MNDTQALYIKLNVKLEPGEELIPDPVWHNGEAHIFSVAGKARRLLARIIPAVQRPQKQRPRGSWGTAIHASDLVREMEAAKPIDTLKPRRRASRLAA